MAVHAESSIQLNTIPAYTSLLGGHFYYKSTNATLEHPTPQSANVIEIATTPSNPSTWGYNTHIGANGIKLRYNEITLSEWINNCLTFYKPGTTNPSLQITGGNNAALNIYNPESNVKTLGLDVNGLSFYGTSVSAPDVTLNADGLTLINGSIRGGVVGQDEFLYLSPQVFSDEYEEYVLSTDTTVDETKTYYTRSGEEGEYVYTEVSEPTGNPQENEYYEIAHAPGTIPIDNYVKNNWRQIIGRNFAVDTDGNLYANGLNAKNANIEGEITATSLIIGNGSNAYNGEAAINVSGYDIVIYEDSTDSSIIDHENTTYLYPVMYHNGEIDNTVDNTHYIWFMDNIEPGTTGDAAKGGIIASYGHSYRVTYDFDDSAVGTGTLVQERIVDPSKYITKISDTGITIHPEFNTNTTSIQLDGTGLDIIKNGVSVAKYSTTVRIGQENNSRFLINSDSLQAYSSTDSSPYFEVSANGLSWGSNIAATTTEVNTLNNYVQTHLIVNNEGLWISPDAGGNKVLIATGQGSTYSSAGTYIVGSSAVLASFTADGIQVGQTDESHLEMDYHSMQMIDKEGDTYFYVSDLRNSSGVATVTDTFFYYNAPFTLTLPNDGVIEITINGVPTSAYTETSTTVTLTSSPSLGSKVAITYATSSPVVKAYTLGVRGAGSLGGMSVAEGRDIVARGTYSHAEGRETEAFGEASHAEGWHSGAGGFASHAEGSSEADGDYSHSEGYGSAMGLCAHAEGYSSADGEYSHAEGRRCTADGDCSHAGGLFNQAREDCQTVIGRYNRYLNTSDVAFMIGNGSSEFFDRGNAFEVDWNGNTTIAGTLTQSSDKRLKNHQSYLSIDAIKFIQNLKPVYFKKDNQFHVGFYAQDVEEIDPWNCMVGEMNGYKTLGYTEIIAPLVAYCQHLEERIKQLEEK